MNAHAFADRHLRRPLNAKLDVTWSELADFEKARWAAVQTDFLDAVTGFLRRRGIATAFVWAREVQPGKGAHTHICLHLGPKPAAVRRKLEKYLITKFKFTACGLRFDDKFGMLTTYMRAGALCYIVKGMDHDAFRYLGNTGATEKIGVAIGIKPCDRGQKQGAVRGQGIVDIKRAGASQNIGRKARRDAGWREVRDLLGLHNLLHPDRGGSAAGSAAPA